MFDSSRAVYFQKIGRYTLELHEDVMAPWDTQTPHYRVRVQARNGQIIESLESTHDFEKSVYNFETCAMADNGPQLLSYMRAVALDRACDDCGLALKPCKC